MLKLSVALWCGLILSVFPSFATAQQGGTFPAGGAVEARLVSASGQVIGENHFFRPDFSVWLQIRVRNALGAPNLGVGRFSGPSATVPASIRLTGQGTMERGLVDSTSGLRGRAPEFRMGPFGEGAPVLPTSDPARANNSSFPSYNPGLSGTLSENGFWTPSAIVGIDGLRAGAFYQVGTPVEPLPNWSAYTAASGQWSPWQNVYCVTVTNVPANGRFTITVTGAASIMTDVFNVAAGGVFAVGTSSTGMRAFSTTRSFRLIAALPPSTNMGPVAQPLPAGPRSVIVPSSIPTPGTAAGGLVLAGLAFARRRSVSPR